MIAKQLKTKMSNSSPVKTRSNNDLRYYVYSGNYIKPDKTEKDKA